VQKVKIKVPVQVFMYRSIPFSGVLIEISGVPKVLIELPITKTSELSVEICAKIEYQKEHREIQCHNGKIPAWKNKMRFFRIIADFIKETSQGAQRILTKLICHKLK